MTEIWDVYDENAQKTGRTMKRGEPLPGDFMLYVVVYLYHPSGKFLIQKRSMAKQTHPGEWDITGGAVLSGEESIYAAIRETEEEIGVRLSESDLRYIGRYKKKNRFAELYFAIKDFDVDKCILQESEVSEVKLVTPDELFRMESEKRKPEYMQMIRGFITNELLQWA